MTRIDWDDYFIEITELIAQRSGCLTLKDALALF